MDRVDIARRWKSRFEALFSATRPSHETLAALLSAQRSRALYTVRAEDELVEAGHAEWRDGALARSVKVWVE